ncbi:MAG: SOS response-associated peptidase [Pseudomonadota bacterium]
MCGRFIITEASDEMARLFEAVPANDLPEVPNYNICPTNQIHAVVADRGVRRLTAMRWGFLPKWYKTLNDRPLLINARGETLAEKPAFRAAARARRCLIPANGFYEWTKTSDGDRLPWFIQGSRESMLAIAGVWQEWERGDKLLTTCAIVTTAANPAMAELHHRMPVILRPEDWALWLGEEGHGAATLMKAAPEDALRWHRVDPAVNSNRAVGEALIVPLAA